MTPDERLDQLEPLISEALAVLDRHTAQLKQHTAILHQHTSSLNQLVAIAGQHSDSIGFLLQGQAELKIQQDEMNGKLDLILNKLG